MKTLNHSMVELSGINLIEASAGTGKTWAIASIYLRLLLEKELLPEQILVVTYTEAATQELRGRIRNRIREALQVMEGRNTSDAFLQGLYEKALASGMKRVLDLLERALGAFDTASIFTIHGFCLRALQDNAFESGSLYDTELVTDQTELLRDIVDDFWRVHFFGESAPLLGYAIQNRITPDKFMSLLRELHAGTGVEVIPDFNKDQIDAIESDCAEAYREVCSLWSQQRSPIIDLIATDKGLSRSEKHYRPDHLEPLFAGMDDFAAGNNPYDLFAGFGKLTLGGIQEGTKSKGVAPSHPFFAACQRLFDAVEDRILALKSELVHHYRKSLPQRKRTANIRFFDDLLEDLYHALQPENGGGALAGILRDSYCAALIDEFQDTDPVQYEIFRTIYAGTGLPLFLIGDPKQAIYSFRGADIFAYMRAAREVDEERRFTLKENWRSTGRLLQAFNTLFDNAKRPFVYDEIVYHPLVAGKREAEETEISLSEAEPMQLRLMDSGNEKNGVLNVDEASAFASAAVADEITRIMQEGEDLHGGRQCTAGDIAVIVRTHRQAAIILDALHARGIAGVMRSNRTVFSSREAEELRILLSSIADPGNEPKVRAALVTDILGRSGDDITGLNSDEESWIACLRQFRLYHDLWRERGCMVMCRELMAREGVRGRLLAYPDSSGERRLTNLLHCFELLHREEHERGRGMEGLLGWFGERRGAQDETDEYQMRLETDDASVKILTVHVSKGLEYPVVFCPFLWGNRKRKEEVLMFHDEAGRLVKDFGSPGYERNRKLAARESLAESLRLLYVALTRAKHRCYLFSCRTRNESSPVNYLLHASEETRSADNQASALASESRTLTSEMMAGQLQAVTGRSDGSIGFGILKRETVDGMAGLSLTSDSSKEDDLLLRRFDGTIDTIWRVSSFTSFSRHEQRCTELPDRDEPRTDGETPIAALAPAMDEKSIFTFPKGAQAGIFMHGIFEELDFASPAEGTIRDLVEKGLERYNYKKDWLPHITEMVHNVLGTSLASRDGAFTLGSLCRKSWITELEFFFPLRFINSALLAGLLVSQGVLPGGVDLASLAPLLHFTPTKGMLMGFMDMVFEHNGRYYLLDWKSNHLGNTVDDYGPDAMRLAMQKNLYPLQYLLYTVALNRYLSLRVENYRYGTHFGGVIYVFLRGVQREKGESRGFFRDLPPETLIEALTNLLIEHEG
ncbi:MAG: exodeoxyribonuclease V subunit beta [Chlorobiaceae bacterium]|nr:exodeoxyribonuclease V subunit beta [Chlorobiaceae bacterium]